MNSKIVEQLIFEFRNAIRRTTGIERYCEQELFDTLGSKPIKIISGFRRTGKSYLARRIAKKALDLGMFNEDDVLYLNFEHFALQEYCTAQALSEIFAFFESLSETQPGQRRKLIIFDEIQRVRDWDKYVRTLYEMRGEEVEIILTGSNSELLSAEIGSNLAGRFIEYKITGFSFKEYLANNDITIGNRAEVKKQITTIQQHFNQWLRYGGLPEVSAINNESAKYSYLQGVYSKVILDDIVQRFGVRNARMLELVFEYVARNNGNILQTSKVAERMKQLDQSIKTTTVTQYLEMLCKAFALNEVSRFDWKSGKLFESQKKYYCVDTGIVNCFVGSERNEAKLLENAVYLELKRRGGKIHYGNNGKKEIDFIARDNQGNMLKYQVVTQLNNENIEREATAFFGGDEYFERIGNVLLYRDIKSAMAIIYTDKIDYRNVIEWMLFN